MNKAIKLFLLLGLAALLASCGSKKNPTGGPEDLEKPTVLTSLPAPYGQISDRVEINFSKALDKSSVTQGIYIYPPVADKKVSVDKSTLLIRFNEALKPNTNYYVTLSTRLKDIRGNALAENQTLIFAHGELSRLRLAGRVNYEDPRDNGLPMQLSLHSADSLLVLDQSFQGSSYALEALNPADYILRAYIDKDKNGRYDFGREPFFEQSADLSRPASLDIALAYADSTLPRITTVKAKSTREIEVLFSETVASIGGIRLVSPDGASELPIQISQLKGSNLTLLTPPPESFTYFVELSEVRDARGNVTTLDRVEFRAEAKIDDQAPVVAFTSPRNGTSVNSLEPVLEVHFSEIIPRAGLKASLRAAESSVDVPLDIMQADADICKFSPVNPLQNYRSYVLTISATDITGNKMLEDYRLNFLPLLRSE